MNKLESDKAIVLDSLTEKYLATRVGSFTTGIIKMNEIEPDKSIVLDSLTEKYLTASVSSAQKLMSDPTLRVFFDHSYFYHDRLSELIHDSKTVDKLTHLAHDIGFMRGQAYADILSQLKDKGVDEASNLHGQALTISQGLLYDNKDFAILVKSKVEVEAKLEETIGSNVYRQALLKNLVNLKETYGYFSGNLYFNELESEKKESHDMA